MNSTVESKVCESFIVSFSNGFTGKDTMWANGIAIPTVRRHQAQPIMSIKLPLRKITRPNAPKQY
ncbi:MAG TPA: hypothetical protein VNY07_13870 [Chthoniobacterales bacterium]|nr:hypothetical protein [Chthoniobacterales bacterium]